MLAASAVLDAIRAEPRCPPLYEVDPPFAPKRLGAAVDEVRARGGGGLYGLAAAPSELALARVWLAQAGGQDVQTVKVAEGWLMIAFVAGVPVVEPRKRREVALWTTHDASPVPGARPDDLDELAVRQWLKFHDPSDWRRVPRVGNADDWGLGGIGVLALDDRTWRPSVAAMVLAGRRPELFVPGCRVVGEADGEAFEVHGPALDLLRALERGPTARLDGHVVREAVVNALLHRDWASDEPIRLTARGERIEVTNPGAFAAGKRPNPLLFQLAAIRRQTRGRGNGLAGLTARLTRQGRPNFSIVSRDGVVRFVAEVQRQSPPEPATVERPRPPVTTPVSVPTPALAPPPVVIEAPVVPALLPRDLDDRADAVLQVLRLHGKATTREVAEILGCSRPVIGKVLTMLVASGRVRPTTEAGRSPFQAYEAVAR